MSFGFSRKQLIVGCVVAGAVCFSCYLLHQSKPNHPKKPSKTISNWDQLMQIPALQRVKGISALNQIFNNILRNPLDSKKYTFKIGNFSTTFGEYENIFINIMHQAGFVKSKNGKRMKFKFTKMKKLKQITEIIETMHCESVNKIHQPPFATQSQTAQNLILTMNCDGNILNCEALKFMANIISIDEDVKNDVYMKKDNVTLMLDYFNHLLMKHDNNYDFELINELLGQCNQKKCMFAKRHYSNTDNEQLLQPFHISQRLIDRIHIHFLHSYDLGYRLHSTEQQALIIRSNKLVLNNVTANELLQSKHQGFYQYNSLKQNMNNKFILTDREYSYGIRFYYWQFFRNLNEPDFRHNNGRSFSDMYVTSRHKSIKEEFTQNPYVVITLQQWNLELQTAKQHESTLYCKRIVADNRVDSEVLKVDQNYYMSCYGIHQNSNVSAHHLIAIMVYCGFDALQNVFSGTLRKTDSHESIDQVKARNSNFHYFSKYLRETVEIFGTKCMDGLHTFWHGINQEMLFSSTSSCIYSVLSTTTSWEVAVNFSNNSGLVMELYCYSENKYFACEWISHFSNEKEKLFIGGVAYFQFVNITNTCVGKDYRLYIEALSVIDTLFHGNYFNEDKMIIERIKKCCVTDEQLVLKSKMNPLLHGAVELSKPLKSLSTSLINHQLNRCYSDKYPKLNSIDPYIEKLLHHICVSKVNVCIRIPSMDVEIAPCYRYGGYIGFKFLKPLICRRNYDSLKFTLINHLFPNVQRIMLKDVSCYDVRLLKDILKCLKATTPCHIKAISVAANEQSEKYSEFEKSIDKMVDMYKLQFEEIHFRVGRSITFSKAPQLLVVENKFYREHHQIFCKPQYTLTKTEFADAIRINDKRRKHSAYNTIV
eukprot:337557_1